ncbi:HAMP domain-containing sensor histidine kinase [Streptantibioticus parmotrematis]|uniref:sensor histidine kinase n=1 Tax=Streptantibioticus parmotrematis TaxID=2873249 RepID=UPI0033F17EB5
MIPSHGRAPREQARPDPERMALAAVRRAFSIRIAVVLTVVMAFIGIVVYAAMLAMQHASEERDLRYAIRRDSVTSPPGCAWLIVERAGRTTASPGTPPGFPWRPAVDRVAAHGTPVTVTVARDGTRYRVLTERHGGAVVQAVYDERFQAEDRDCLLMALGVAELLGAAASVVAGAALAHRAMAPLGETLRRQRRFVTDASHELRAPLTRLHTRAQLLARTAGRDEAAEQLAAEAARLAQGTRQLGAVIDDILRSARVTAQSGGPSTVDLAELAAQTVAEEDARAAQGAVSLDVAIGPGPHLVAGAECALRRALTALLDNALRHTPRGGSVVVAVAAHGHASVRLSVRDTGTGFPPEAAQRLFERFARGDHGRSEGNGYGLGLALAREVVTAHRGTITADGEPGGGATFTITLPALRPAPVRLRIGRRAPGHRVVS